MIGLRVSQSVHLSTDTVTSTVAVLARKGSGKTYFGKVLAEEMIESGNQVVLLDPVGVCWGLRTSSDGNSPGIPILILGGDHGDIPLDSKSGAMVANFLISSRQSAVLDLGLFSQGEMKRFVADLGEELYRLNRAPLHLILDEADMFAPQRPMDGEQKMLGAIDKIVRRGRARGLGMTMLTQRPAALNKNVLTQCETLVLMRLMSPQDRAAVKEWVNVHSTTEELSELMTTLPTLVPGEAWFWSPGNYPLTLAQVRKLKTYDSSATPKVGEATSGVKTLADVDLDALREAFAQQFEESDNPATLKARIKDLESQLAAKADQTSLREMTEAANALRERLAEAVTALRIMRDKLAEIEQLASVENLSAETPPLKVAELASEPKPVSLAEINTTKRKLIKNAAKDPDWPAEKDSKLTPGATRILVAIANLLALGRPAGDRRVVAVLSGQSPKSGSYAQNLAALRSRNLIETVADGIALTEAGRAVAPKPDKPATLEAYHDSWMSFLSATQGRMLSQLIDLYPRNVTREQLATMTSQSPKSGSYAQNLAKLRSFQLIEGSKDIRAADLLFPGGLK